MLQLLRVKLTLSILYDRRLKAQKMLQLLRVIVATLFLLLSCAESIKKYIMLRMIFKRGLCLKWTGDKGVQGDCCNVLKPCQWWECKACRTWKAIFSTERRREYCDYKPNVGFHRKAFCLHPDHVRYDITLQCLEKELVPPTTLI
jgi:hypothetical protein